MGSSGRRHTGSRRSVVVGVPSPEWEERFDDEGRMLALDLQRELGDMATVRYWRDPT
jgi:hypothetical protein